MIHLIPLLVALLAWQPPQTSDVTIPALNQPKNFSGAAGVYQLAVSAEPIAVRVEDPITLTVKIASMQAGLPAHPPQRDKLRLLPPAMQHDFFIEPLPEEDRFLEKENAWRFSWRLMPKHTGVEKIPSLEFVYYHTDTSPDFKATDAPSIALKVTARPATVLVAPSDARQRFQWIVDDSRLLAGGPASLRGFNQVIAALTIPPILCVALYLTWRQLFPEAAERLRRQRSKALRKALKQLSCLAASASPAHIRDVVASYLRLHVDLPSGGPTPPEVKRALLHQSLPSSLATKTEQFLQRCDAAEFAPAPLAQENDLKIGAAQLLQQLEVALCASKSL